MQFESLEAFIRMGTHGPFVWSAYGISMLLLVSNLWLAVRGHRQVRRHLAQRLEHSRE